MPRKVKSASNKALKEIKEPSAVSRMVGWFDQDRRRLVRRCMLWISLVSVAAVSAVWGLRRLEHRILTNQKDAKPLPARIVLVARPNWMPDSLAREISNELLPRDADYHDPDLTRLVYESARQHPWIRDVELACKIGQDKDDAGRVELRAAFRQPAAQVLGYDGYYRFVDTEGYVLPPMQVPRFVVRIPKRGDEAAQQICYVSGADVPPDRRASPIHYVTVKGASEASPGVGKPWKGQDLADGLKLIQLIAAKPYASQITVVDVHKAPFLRMYAQIRDGRRTEITFGRFPVPGGDYVVPTSRKLAYLDSYVAENDGRLAGVHSRIDLCLDQLYVSSN